MKITMWNRLIVVLFCSGLAASSVRADLQLREPTIDLGEVRAGVRLSKEVSIVNDSGTAVEIVETRGSCGCVSPRVEPRIIPPIDQATLHLSINTLGEGAGPHAWKTAVRYREGNEVKEIELTLRAKIVTEITIQPASLTFITEGGQVETLVLTDFRPAPLTVKQVEVSADFLKARIVAQNSRTTKIQLEVARVLPPGRHAELLTIHTDDPLYGELRVPVTIVKATARAVTIDPPEVRLDPAAGITSRMVRIRSRDGQPVTIARVEAEHPAFRCKWAAGDDGDMFLRITAESLPAAVSASRVVVILSEPAREELAIPVSITR